MQKQQQRQSETNFEFDGLEGWICVHDTHWPQKRETSAVGAPFQLQLGVGTIRKFFEKGKTQDLKSLSSRPQGVHWPLARQYVE
jgi:hypothetical protein